MVATGAAAMLPNLSTPTEKLRVTCECGNLYWVAQNDQEATCEECRWKADFATTYYRYRIQPVGKETTYAFVSPKNALQMVQDLETMDPGRPVVIWRVVDCHDDETDVQVVDNLFPYQEITKQQLVKAVAAFYAPSVIKGFS